MSLAFAWPAIGFFSLVPLFTSIFRVSTGHGLMYEELRARWLPSQSLASRWRAPLGLYDPRRAPLGLYDPIIKSVAALSVAANRALKVASPVMSQYVMSGTM